MKEAIDLGYRHFDCAYFYGNEEEIGVGIRKKIDDGTVKREDLFVTSKVNKLVELNIPIILCPLNVIANERLSRLFCRRFE